MIRNRYKRILDLRAILSGGYGCFLGLEDRHVLWKRLTKEQRIKAMKFGAIAYIDAHGEDVCPEFSNEKGLRLWIRWLLEQDDLDEELREAIEDCIVG